MDKLRKRQHIAGSESAIASYDWTELASGEGNVTYILTSSENNEYKSYKMVSTALPSSDSDGLIPLGYEVYFKSSSFNFTQRIQGTAYLTGHIDLSSGSASVSAKISIESGTLSTDGLGSITWTGTGNGGAGSHAVSLRETIDIDGYVNRFTTTTTAGTGGATYHFDFYYEGGESFNRQTITSAGLQTISNPYPEKIVSKILCYAGSGSGGYSYSAPQVYEENTSGLTTTDISSEVTGPSVSADSNVNLEIPLTSTQIKRGERIVLKITSTGSGSLVLDPTAEFVTKESLKLNVPFKIDL